MSSLWPSTKPGTDPDNRGVVNPTSEHQSLLADPTQTRISNDKENRVFTATYTTPHDDVLAELHGSLLKGGLNDSTPQLDHVKENQAIVPELGSTGALLKDHASSAAQQPASRFSSSDILIDPFDGSNLGVLLPYSHGLESQNPSQVNLINNPESGFGTTSANPVGSDAVWSQLSRVLDIQSEISKMHLEMESIGVRAGSADRKGKRHPWKGHHKTASGKTAPSSLDPSGMNWPRKRAMSTVSTISSGEREGDESGVNFHDEEEEKSRIRAEEFAKLSSQFEGRKTAIHDMMAKLDDLSRTLSEFHALPIPNIEFTSRNNSLGITSTTIDAPPEPKLEVLQPSPNLLVTKLTEEPADLSTAPAGARTTDEISGDISTLFKAQKTKVPAPIVVDSLELENHPVISESPVSNIGGI